MKIRKADINDINQIITLNKIVDYDNPDNFFEESIQLGRVLVASDNGRILWFLLYQELWGNTTILSLIKIHSDYYQKGIGTKLLNEFESILRDNWRKSYISSTMLNNIWAQTFHDKSGFVSIGELRMNCGDEKFYKKNL